MKIGILGAGQLGRMLALAGYPLGMRFRFFEPAPDSPANLLADHLTADYADEQALRRFVDGLDVVTYEFENVPVLVARFLEQFVPVYPPPIALEKAQDRLVEKTFFSDLGIPTPSFTCDLDKELSSVGLPAVLKTRRMGYDGKGQFVVRSQTDLADALVQLAGQDVILERFVPFERELSIVCARGRDGAVVFYPLAENTHRDGILRLSIVDPARFDHRLQSQAESYARAVLDALNYVGVLAIEFFEIDGQLLANEMAPRVHNSGHWTMDGAITSQFENHIRAVSGLPLGATSPLGACAMVNLVGQIPAAASILKIEGTHLHLYDKAPRAGRKVGHINLVADSQNILNQKIGEVQKYVG
ncbi:MAG: 5-(carboxyamino)imidazole ribonucleotide synthase [Anaerolineae bacterium]|nr:5-(carboxyamino)imidazole ribonucleotide synthase [Anaerolineae bacterium]